MNRWQEFKLLTRSHPVVATLLVLEWLLITVFFTPLLTFGGSVVLATVLTVASFLALILVTSAFV